MEQAKRYLDERIEEKFKLVEDKLRNSFQAIKKDNEFIKNKIKELGENIDRSNSAKVFTELDKFKAEVKIDLNQIAEQISNSTAELKDIEIEPINEDIKQIKRELNKKDIRNDIRDQLRKEIYAEFEKKINNEFEKFSDTTKDIKQNVSAYKKEVLNRVDYATENLEETSNGLKQIIEEEKEAFARTVKSRNDSLEREFSKLKDKISEKLYASFEERDEKIKKLEGQMAYFKGKLKEDKVPEIPNFKEIERQRKEMEKAAKALQVEKEKTDKKKPFFIRVLTGKKVPAKDFKKLDKEKEKGFSKRIVRSLSEK